MKITLLFIAILFLAACNNEVAKSEYTLEIEKTADGFMINAERAASLKNYEGAIGYANKAYSYFSLLDNTIGKFRAALLLFENNSYSGNHEQVKYWEESALRHLQDDLADELNIAKCRVDYSDKKYKTIVSGKYEQLKDSEEYAIEYVVMLMVSRFETKSGKSYTRSFLMREYNRYSQNPDLFGYVQYHFAYVSGNESDILEAIKQYKYAGNSYGIADSYLLAGRIFATNKKYREATDYFKSALDTYTALNDKESIKECNQFLKKLESLM